MEEFINILIIAAILIGSFVGKAKKQQKKSTTETPPPVIPKSRKFEEEMREIMREFNIPENTPSKQQPKVVITKPEYIDSVAPDYFEKKQQGYSNFSKQTSNVSNKLSTNMSKPIIDSDEDNADLSEIRMNTPSDAKKAFIYAEIFNRKY